MKDNDKTKEQMRAINQQLLASEQQLRAANQQLEANNQQLIASEQEIKKEKEFSENLLITANVFILTLDINANITLFNRFAEKLTGYKKEEVLGRNWFDLFIPKRNGSVIPDVFSKVLKKMPEFSSYENPVLCKDGTERLISWKNTVLKNDNGKISGILSIGTDITEHKKAEEELKTSYQQLSATEQQLRAANQQFEAANQQLSASEQQLRVANKELMASEQRFRKYFEQSLIGMTITSTEKGWIEINDVLCKMLGYTKEELHEMTWVEITHPDDLEADLSQFNRMLANEIDSYMLEKRFIRKDGNIIYTAISMNAYRNKTDQSVEYVLALVHDITERKQVEEELQTQSKFIDNLIENSALSTWISDENGTAIRANPACLNFFGATAEEVVGKYNLFKDEVLIKQGLIPELKKVFEKSEVVNVIIDYDFGDVGHVNVKNATHKIIKSVFSPITDKNNKVINAICQSMDLTDIKQAEKALRQFKKIVESTSGHMSFIDINYIYLEVNNSYIQAHKKKREEIVGHSIAELMGVEVFENVIKDKFDACLTGEIVRYENWFDFAESGKRYMDVCYYPYFDENYKVTGIIVDSHDITERNQAEAELQKYRDHLEDLVKERTEELEKKNIELERYIKSDKVFYKKKQQGVTDEFCNKTIIKNIFNRYLHSNDCYCSVL